jgi:hypothetical protein
MARYCRSILIVLLVVGASRVHAVDIQYLLSNGTVTGVQRDGDPQIGEVPDHGVVTVAGTASQILWPVPGGCSVGRPEWSRITDPDTVTLAGGGMAVRIGLVVFSTTSSLLMGCHQVSNLAQLNALYRQVMVDVITSYGFLGALNEVSVGVRETCPGATGGGPACDTARGNLATLNRDRPGAAGVANFTTDLVTLRTDKCAFQAAQGWGSCP